ncbi:hypothetical protein [Nocardioides sp. W7]|uniref:hypothetical protein n=1 Tax=Nocardioides sp. W7 TaxID=2931390 RepID=UPI001FD3CAC5|nr:hypothetical protein [Nocardioides sp. W7]
MLALLILPVFYGVALAHRFLQIHAPSNRLCRRVRSSSPRWRTAMALIALAAVLLIAMHAVAETIARGAPGWLNLVVLVLAWDSIKIFLAGLLVAARCVGGLCTTAMGSLRAQLRPAETGTPTGSTTQMSTQGVSAPR